LQTFDALTHIQNSGYALQIDSQVAAQPHNPSQSFQA
jgi:hypothetical protein